MLLRREWTKSWKTTGKVGNALCRWSCITWRIWMRLTSGRRPNLTSPNWSNIVYPSQPPLHRIWSLSHSPSSVSTSSSPTKKQTTPTYPPTPTSKYSNTKKYWRLATIYSPNCCLLRNLIAPNVLMRKVWRWCWRDCGICPWASMTIWIIFIVLSSVTSETVFWSAGRAVWSTSTLSLLA